MDPAADKEPGPRFSGSKRLMWALAVLSFIVYAAIWNPAYALLIMISLLVHEMGHVWALWHYGLKVTGVYSIPLLGAAVVTKDQPPDRLATVVFVLMGPAWGFALAAATYLVAIVADSPLFSSMAAWMAVLNLFNLYPAVPLDGGQAWKGLVSPFPRPLRLTLEVLPLLGLALIAWTLGGWLPWMICAVSMVVASIEAITLFWRRRDRARICMALSDLVWSREATPESVLARIEEAMMQLRTYALRKQMHPMFGRGGPAEMLVMVMQHWPDHDPSQGQEQAFRLYLYNTAKAARYVRKTVRGKTIDATASKELWAGNQEPFIHTPLAAFLRGEALTEPMPPVKAVTGFVAYGLLAFGLLSLLWIAREMPGAYEAMVKLTRNWWTTR